MKETINIITLGCSKNTVDSEKLAAQLSPDYKILFDDNKPSAIVIINTCGFIQDSKTESIDMIIQAINSKEKGGIKKIYVMGCLSQRYKNELEKEMPEVDGFFGVEETAEILQTLKTTYNTELQNERKLSTPKHYAYLKISEGCDRKCAFCAIPEIRGRHKSETIENLVKETRNLVKKGVKEIILIAQDLSYYGYDIYKKFALPELLENIANIKEVKWIRLHYTYPLNFTDSLISVMKKYDNICKYVDIPIQHISDNMPKIMRRGHGEQKTRELIKKLRSEIPEIAIRTTVLVGHPGETKKDIEKLGEYVRETKFDRLGIFTYSEEENTYAGDKLKDEISEAEKQKRADYIMEIQENISAALNEKRIGKTYKVLIDRREKGKYFARTQFDSPEVDNEVIIETPDYLNIGEFYKAKITASDNFDLYGEIE